MSRRANGEGSIYKRSDGRWCATVSVDGGKRKSFYGNTRHDVARKLAEALKARQDGLPLPAGAADGRTVPDRLAGERAAVAQASNASALRATGPASGRAVYRAPSP